MRPAWNSYTRVASNPGSMVNRWAMTVGARVGAGLELGGDIIASAGDGSRSTKTSAGGTAASLTITAEYAVSAPITSTADASAATMSPAFDVAGFMESALGGRPCYTPGDPIGYNPSPEHALEIDHVQFLIVMGIGLGAGLIGGLAGIGGSLIMLPALAIVLGYSDEAKTEHHLYMAAAMTVNILVAVPAAYQHAKKGAVRKDLVKVLLPSVGVAIVVGVLVSNSLQGTVLRMILAGFIAVYCVNNFIGAIRGTHETPADSKVHVAGLVGTGGVTGFMAGLLGLGGGVIMVPMMQVLGRVPLRQAIASSAMVMSFTAAVGASIKLATLHTHDFTILQAMFLVAGLGPMAIVGSTIGAKLTHALPLRVVKLSISVLLFAAAVRLSGLV